MKVSVADAKNRLPELIKAAEAGETVTICRRGVPAVDIVRTKKPSRKKRLLGGVGEIEKRERTTGRVSPGCVRKDPGGHLRREIQSVQYNGFRVL